MNFDYDVIVVGAGAGGLTCAIGANGGGKKVLLVEKNKPGGECTWSGCVPSKGLINVAKEVHAAKKYVDFTPDTKKALEEVRNVIARVYAHETPEVLTAMGIEYLNGAATFVDKNTISVNDKNYSATNIVIATGSSPFVPPIEGLSDVDYLTNESIFTQVEFKKSMVILGGGAIGIEMAQAVNRLGVEVHLVEMAKNILIREDQELVGLLRERLVEEGVNIHTETKALKVRKNGNNIVLTVEKDGKESEIEAESLLVAVGRKANIDNLAIENAGVERNQRAIVVDNHLKTTANNIYAVGDVVGPYQFSHMANFQGVAVVKSLIIPVYKASVDYEHVSWCTFTEPELASAGITEAAAKESGKEFKVYRYTANDLDRAKTKANDIFEVKIICDSKKKILGCQILADRAGELISEVQAIKANGLGLNELAKVIHPYPSYGEIFAKAGKAASLDKLKEGKVASIASSLKGKK